MTNNWQSGLFDCFADWKICCYGWWCTARLYAENAVQINGHNYDDAYYTYLNSGQDACPWIPVTATRKALRDQYNLPEEPCDDCKVIFWCAPCSVCQAARELKIRKNISENQSANDTIHVPSGVCTKPVRTVQPQKA